MWSDKSEEAYIGDILRELNSGKTLKSLLLCMNWKQRARLLLNIKTIKRCHNAFQQEVADTQNVTNIK